MATIPNSNLLSQSPYLYLQGAGSDGSDGSAAGVHLRWDFNESLAEVHIPKGNLASQGTYYTTAGFNKANDFVKIYRTSYNRNFPIIIDFASMAPSQIIDVPNQIRVWRYDNIVPIPSLSNNTCNVLIRFTNTIKYNQAKLQYNPAVDRLNFLKNYNDIIEVEVENRFMFAAYVQMQTIDQMQDNITRIESISRTNNTESDRDALFISCRKKHGAGDSFLLKEDLDFLLQENGGYLELDMVTSEKKIMAENIKYIRFRGDNCFPTRLLLETYYDFLLGKNMNSDWQPMADLSLSITESEVFERLEKPSAFQIDNFWPKYVNDAKVNVKNYKDRWNTGEPEERLLNGVINYLTLSKDANNLTANNSSTAVEDEFSEEFEYSYLALLKLAAFDFHIARMLGFGYIDAGISNTTDKYMYIAVYETTAALDNLPAGPIRTHTYMTLPVSKTDYKLPVTPKFKGFKYGLTINNGAEIPIQLTDENGYGKYDDSRAIGLLVERFNSMKRMDGFFIPDEEYCYVDSTEPILYGIAYKKNGVAQWRKPEINNDPEFKDHQNINEPVAVIRPDTESECIYTHFETEAGIHDYAIYGVNWFSRVSPLSDILSTNETIFPIRNTLIPPLNLGVQLIQKENPLILTTRAEQERLNAITSTDKTLVRLTFEWNDIHASNYWYGREAEFFFRVETLGFVKGKIKSVIPLPDSGQGIYDIRTESYNIASGSEPQTVMPAISSGKESRFVKSFLTTDEDQYQYEVQSVRQSNVSGEGVIFTVRASENRTTTEQYDNDNIHLAVNAPVPPTVGSIFSVPENASLTVGWPVKLTQKVALKKLSEHTEPYTDSEGTTIDIHIGGVFAKATISDILDIDNNNVPISGSKTGAYWIAFNNYILPPHGDSEVEWYKGSVRIKVIMGGGKEEMRVLDVWDMPKKDINGIPTSNLQLIAYDSTFDVGSNYVPNPGYVPIPVGGNIDVNYHPGYRVYFTYETGFSQSSLLPAAGAGSKQTLIACRSTDPTVGGGIASPLSNPAVILAREIIEPMPPDPPEGALFATRPNFYGKASYTFDTGVKTGGGREPYALVFYRANEQIILDALYKHDTVLQIQSDLAQIENDTAFNTRWFELVNVETNNVTKQFNELNGYRFPNPDNNEFRIPNPNPNAAPIYPFSASKNPGSEELVPNTGVIFGTQTNKTYKEIVKFAINNAFLSLTEQPVLYRYLKTGYQTSDRKPVIKDSNGDLIIPGSNSYDGSPMAVKLPNSNAVRFTDYTLDGASTSIFFYYAVEMNNTLTMSDRSDILGPILLTNTAPPKAPEIREFHTRLENTVTGDTTAVLFEINDYPEGEEISKILTYRTLNSIDAMSVRTMQLVATIDVNDPIIDDFSDLGFYPFGEVLYYRLVAVRTIKTGLDNDIYETEDVPSYPSPLILANIIDVNNPPAPELTYTADENGDVLENVVIEWEPTAYNGTYRLYQMNNSGNWTELCTISPPDSNTDMQYELPDSLPTIDEDGNTIFYRFKVTVENTSGLFSLEDNILLISAITDQEIQPLEFDEERTSAYPIRDIAPPYHDSVSAIINVRGGVAPYTYKIKTSDLENFGWIFDEVSNDTGFFEGLNARSYYIDVTVIDSLDEEIHIVVRNYGMTWVGEENGGYIISGEIAKFTVIPYYNGATYQWSGPDGFLSNEMNSQFMAGNPANPPESFGSGNYILTIERIDGMPNEQYTVPITVYAIPPSPIVTTPTATVTGGSGNVTLNTLFGVSLPSELVVTGQLRWYRRGGVAPNYSWIMLVGQNPNISTNTTPTGEHVYAVKAIDNETGIESPMVEVVLTVIAPIVPLPTVANINITGTVGGSLQLSTASGAIAVVGNTLRWFRVDGGGNRTPVSSTSANPTIQLPEAGTQKFEVVQVKGTTVSGVHISDGVEVILVVL